MKSFVTVTREAKFDAAHSLPDHDSPCRHVHGHTWVLSVSVTGPVLPLEATTWDRGMVVDMRVLKGWLAQVTSNLDHANLNDHLEHPTTERVLTWLAARAKSELEPRLPKNCWVSRLTLCEQPLTPGFWAEVSFARDTE
jgi:6-pyruvoyltetrahydropterin/6-carboxytetrahydropterin synthase